MHARVRLRIVPAFAVLLTSLAAGCSREATSVDAPTPSARKASKSIADPIAEQEITLFLSVLENLPGGQAPEFAPLSQATADEHLPATRLAQIYRQEYRATFDASRHGQRWRQNKELMATFQQLDVEPEDFAALMIRISCAIAANAIDSGDDLADAVAHVDAQVAQMIDHIERLDADPGTLITSDERRSLLDSLQQLVAFSEFGRILKEVPARSRQLVAQHKSALEPHLPEPQTAHAFERTIESTIVPTSLEQPADPATR